MAVSYLPRNESARTRPTTAARTFPSEAKTKKRPEPLSKLVVTLLLLLSFETAQFDFPDRS